MTARQPHRRAVVLHRWLQQLHKQLGEGVGGRWVRPVELVEQEHGGDPLSGEREEVSLLEEQHQRHAHAEVVLPCEEVSVEGR